MFIDAHTHLMPDRLGKAIRRFFEQGISGALVYPLDNQEVLSRLDDEGVTRIWNLPYAHKAGVASTLNADMLLLAEALAEQPVEIVSGCTVHPDDPDPAQDLERAADAGARVLKLHCSVGDYQPDDRRLRPVLATAGRLGMPVVIHAGKAVSGSTAAQDLEPIARAAVQNADTTIILAHFGHHATEAGANLLRAQENVFADLTPVVLDPVPLTKALAEEFSDRLLFGSDAPNTGCSVPSLVAALDRLDLDAETYAKITYQNALGLTQV